MVNVSNYIPSSLRSQLPSGPRSPLSLSLALSPILRTQPPCTRPSFSLDLSISLWYRIFAGKSRSRALRASHSNAFLIVAKRRDVVSFARETHAKLTTADAIGKRVKMQIR